MHTKCILNAYYSFFVFVTVAVKQHAVRCLCTQCLSEEDSLELNATRIYLDTHTHVHTQHNNTPRLTTAGI